MNQSLLHRYRSALRIPHWRRLLMAVAVMVLLVQTGFPAHQDSHPIGSQDNLCQYCVLAAHRFGVPGVTVIVPAVPVYAEYQFFESVQFHVRPFPCTRFSRGPLSLHVV